jgi:hypothetical protein
MMREREFLECDKDIPRYMPSSRTENPMSQANLRGKFMCSHMPVDCAGIDIILSETLHGIISRRREVASQQTCSEGHQKSGGGGGIRTPETLSGLTVFKTAGFNRSPTPPLPILSHCGGLVEFEVAGGLITP